MPAGRRKRRELPPSLWPLWLAVFLSIAALLALWAYTQPPTP